MKTETITYVRESTSSAGVGWILGTAAPDSVASQIKNCTIVRQPTIVVGGSGFKFHANEGSVLKRLPTASKLSSSIATRTS